MRAHGFRGTLAEPFFSPYLVHQCGNKGEKIRLTFNKN